MISFFINLFTLGRTLARGFRQDDEFRTLIILLLSLLLCGTIFYWRAEGWTVLDALYFCVMTIATVGYGDLAPTTPYSKAFTIGLVILGIGLFASFVGKLVALRMAYHAEQRERRRPKTTRD